jgi:hypothetical protein
MDFLTKVIWVYYCITVLLVCKIIVFRMFKIEPTLGFFVNIQFIQSLNSRHYFV